jgi:hypothetical protein
MKWHVEAKHLELLTTYVKIFAIADDISRSQSRDDEGCVRLYGLIEMPKSSTKFYFYF